MLDLLRIVENGAAGRGGRDTVGLGSCIAYVDEQDMR